MHNSKFTGIDLLNMYANYYSLNKSQLAENLGISRPTLNKYLSGSVPVPTIYQKFIALDFNIPSRFLEFDFINSDTYAHLQSNIDSIPF